MTSPRPPRLRDIRSRDDRLRQDRQNLKQLDHGLLNGLYPPARPVTRPFSDGEEDDDELEIIQFLNTDQKACLANGANIIIPLTHVPEDGSEQVYYNGIALKRTDWYRTDTVLTIPGEPWFRAGKVAWVDYAYYDQEADTEPPSFVSATTIQGDHASIDLPGGANAGDLLVLVLKARDTAGCSDPRFTLKHSGDSGRFGIWVGTDDGSGSAVPITLSSPSGGGVDGCGALVRISGSPLLPVTSELTGHGGGASYAPTMPTLGSFGLIGIVSGTTLTAGSLGDEQLGHWTTRASVEGGGVGYCSLYIGTAAGLPTGQWANSGGSSAGYDSWAGGLQ